MSNLLDTCPCGVRSRSRDLPEDRVFESKAGSHYVLFTRPEDGRDGVRTKPKPDVGRRAIPNSIAMMLNSCRRDRSRAVNDAQR